MGRQDKVVQLEDALRLAQDESAEARRQLEDVHQLLTDFLNYNPVLSFIKDEKGRYLYASTSFAAFFNVKQKDFIGKTDFEWLPAELARQFTENDNRVRATGKPIETIETVPFPQGTIHSLVCKFPIVTPSGRQFVGGTALDITDRREAEDQIAQLNRQLEARIAELALVNGQMEQARDQAVKALNVKSAFLSCVSHELRTPLTTIKWASDLLQQAPLEGNEKMMADVVQESAVSLMRLINDILDVSAIESSRLTIEIKPFDLKSTVKESANSIAYLLEEKGLTMRTALDESIPDSLVGDSLRVKQILLNLLSNAVKFTSVGHIAVSASLQDQDEERVSVKLSIEDTGIGIAEADMRLIFQPFSQLDSSTTRQYGGTGLGLSISKSLAEIMGGSIEASSRISRGSVFSVTIPFARCVS